MNKLRQVIYVALGVLIIAMAGCMIAIDFDYVLTGNTVNLNEAIENGEAPPRDKYVTYTCYTSLGNYAETQGYIWGVIPMPGKTQQYAILAENDIIISAEIRKKSTLEEMNRLEEELYSFSEDADPEPVVLVGFLSINSHEMDNLLDEYFSDLGDLDEIGITLSSYKIDTTKTRLQAALLDLFVLAAGVVILVFNVRELIKVRGSVV